jgi:hypothetical protein
MFALLNTAVTASREEVVSACSSRGPPDAVQTAAAFTHYLRTRRTGALADVVSVRSIGPFFKEFLDFYRNDELDPLEAAVDNPDVPTSAQTRLLNAEQRTVFQSYIYKHMSHRRWKRNFGLSRRAFLALERLIAHRLIPRGTANKTSLDARTKILTTLFYCRCGENSQFG